MAVHFYIYRMTFVVVMALAVCGAWSCGVLMLVVVPCSWCAVCVRASKIIFANGGVHGTIEWEEWEEREEWVECMGGVAGVGGVGGE